MPTVTFDCTCPQSTVDLDIQPNGSGTSASVSFESSGKKKRTLRSGEYSVLYRAIGTSDTELKLSVEGGKMRAVNRTIPDDGRAAGERTLVVE